MSEDASQKRFIVDVMLGKLAKWLRVLGFDAACVRLSTREQVDAYLRQGYLLITRSQKWRGPPGIFQPTSNDPAEQLREVISGIPIQYHEVHPLRRCILCNERLQRIPHDQVFGEVPDYVFETNTLFQRCPRCRKLYWPGSHQKHMMERLRGLFAGSDLESNP